MYLTVGKSTVQPSGCSLYWPCRFCALLLSSLDCDSSCDTLTLELKIFHVHLGCVTVMMPLLSSYFFPAVSRALSKQQWAFPEGGSEGTPVKTPFQGWRGAAEPSNCLHTNEMSQKFLLICFRSDSSSSRSCHNIFQDEFTLSLSSLFSIEIHHLELRPLCTDIIYKLGMHVEWACFCLSFSHCFLGLLLSFSAWI